MASGQAVDGIKKLWGGLQDKLQTGSSTFYPPPCGDALKTGWLKKPGGVMKSWQRRWFKLEQDQLHYFSGQDEAKLQGSIWLPGNNVVEHAMNPAKPDEFLFEIIPAGDKTKIAQQHDTYLLCACSDDERKSWMGILKRVMYARKGGAIFGNSISFTLENEIRLRGPRKIPEIVEICSNYIIENGLETEGIFRLPGRAALIREFKEKFDTGQRPSLESGFHDIPTIASLLKQYLRDLPEPLVPFSFYERVMRVVNREMPLDPDLGTNLLKEILDELPRDSYNLLQYLFQLLNKIASFQDTNKMTPMNLATVFVHCVIRPEDDDPALLMGTANSRTQCTFFFIIKVDELFARNYPVGERTAVDEIIEVADGIETDYSERRNYRKLSTGSSGDEQQQNGEIEYGEEAIANDYVHVPVDDLLGFDDEHFSTSSVLQQPLTPNRAEENALNRRGSRKGRVFNDMSYGDSLEFDTAEYVDSEKLHRTSVDNIDHEVRFERERENETGFYPGYETVSQINTYHQNQGASENQNELEKENIPNQNQPCNVQVSEDYSHLTNYSSNPQPPKTHVDDDDYSYLPGSDDAKPILRKKHSTHSSLSDTSRGSSINRPKVDPPKPPPPRPRPRRSLNKRRSGSVGESSLNSPEGASDTSSIYSLPIDSINEGSHTVQMRERASRLLAVDLNELPSRDELVAHIQRLNLVITDQSREITRLTQTSMRDKATFESELKKKEEELTRERAKYHKEIEEKDRMINEEKQGTMNAVNRVMALQTDLQRYITRYGSMIEDKDH